MSKEKEEVRLLTLQEMMEIKNFPDWEDIVK